MTEPTVDGQIMSGGLGDFPNTAKGMCELTKAASEHFDREAKPEQRVIGTIEAWLLDYGSEYEYRPRPEWLPRGEPNHCFVNSLALVLSLEGKERGLTYCEGYVRDPVCPINIHHAWTIDSDGIVVDPTLPEEEWDEETITFFGVSVPTEPLIELFGSEHGTGCLLGNHRGRELVETVNERLEKET
jgi:hypothetical protein